MPRPDARPVVVFDLDGTILTINSFPRWVLFLAMGRVPGLGARRRAALSVVAIALLLQRKLALIDHDEFMWRLQHAWRSACATRPQATLARFEASLLRSVRPNLAAVLELVASGQIDAVLATAAAEDYAVGLARRLGFRHVLATNAARERDEPGNSGVHKRERVLAWLEQHGWGDRPIVLLTDHPDDLPLMQESQTVYWCGRPDDTITAANCHQMSAEELASRIYRACHPERSLASTSS